MFVHVSFLIKDEKLLEKYNAIWKRASNIIKKGFDSKPVYKEKHLKTKIKSYNGKINKIIHNNKITKEGSQWIFVLVILKNVNMLLKKKRRLSLSLLLRT